VREAGYLKGFFPFFTKSFMATQSATDTFEAQKEKLQEILHKLAAQFDLDEEDVTTAKEWGVALLVTGVSVYIIYRLFQRMFGVEKEVVVEEDEPEGDSDYSERFSAIADMLKGQLGLILVAVARRQIMRFLRRHDIIDDDE
jgi:hypothetical protein